MSTSATIMQKDMLRAIENVKNLASFKIDKERRIISWNAGAKRLIGHDNAGIIGRDFLSLVSDDESRSEFQRFFEKGKGRKPLEIYAQIVGKGNKKFWAGVTLSPIFDELGERKEYEVVIHGVSDRKIADNMMLETERQLRALAIHLQTAREEERTRIAREMHNEFGQRLTALRMDLSVLERMIGHTVKEPLSRMALIEKVTLISDLLEKTIRSTRRIITELRPAVLDELGLLTAIQWQALEFENRTGIRCKITRLQHDITLDQNASTNIFRILQEALANAAKHASPSNVTISLQQIGKDLVLEVADDGKGMQAEKQRDPTSTGLIGIRERVIALNGKFEVHSKRGQGTILKILIPYKRS
jgi:PAS domain S-box-containing protein